MKFTDYNNTVISAGLNPSAGTIKDGVGTTVQLSDYLQVVSLQYDAEQTLNIGSQSTGAGAGKVTFNPLTIVKGLDALSPKLFQFMCAGTAFKTVEILFAKPTPDNSTTAVYFKIILKLAAVKTQAISSVADCSNGCVAESVSFEYGGLQLYTYKPQPNGAFIENPVHGGWNRVTNTPDL